MDEKPPIFQAAPPEPAQGDDVSLNARLRAHREESARRVPAFAGAYDRLVQRLRETNRTAAGPQVGETLPDFDLPDATGALVSLSRLLQAGPVVVSLNRGHWCPYCRLDLRALAGIYPDIRALGAEVVSIMPDAAAFTAGYAKENALPFPLLSDMDGGYALSLGLLYWPGSELEGLYADGGIALSRYQRNESHFLPIVSKFVVARDGTIAARFIDVEFRQRTEPAAILAAVRALPSA